MRYSLWVVLVLGVSSTDATRALAQPRLDLFQPEPKRAETLMSNVGTFWIRVFQKFISPQDGKKCGLRPSCSEYSRQCFRQHGSFRGWLMTSDRLQRCHPKKSQGFYRIREGTIIDTPHENLAREQQRCDLFAATRSSKGGSFGR
ncbi:MAG TPA: membrane protein insertion efficiency factor YidD [bacterium]|nr:membrane protein insertion efficiency factor YidD [bacterium]